MTLIGRHAAQDEDRVGPDGRTEEKTESAAQGAAQPGAPQAEGTRPGPAAHSFRRSRSSSSSVGSPPSGFRGGATRGERAELRAARASEKTARMTSFR